MFPQLVLVRVDSSTKLCIIIVRLLVHDSQKIADRKIGASWFHSNVFTTLEAHVKPWNVEKKEKRLVQISLFINAIQSFSQLKFSLKMLIEEWTKIEKNFFPVIN